MTFLFNALLFVHLLGMATLIGAFFLQWRDSSTLSALWFWGALVQAVTGLAMVGLRDAGVVSTPLDTSGHIKIGVKLLVLLVITLLAVVARNRAEKIRPLAITMGALTVLNAGIAVFWS